MNFCECGCGRTCKNRFVIGHYWRGKKHTTETVIKLRRPKSEEHKRKIGTGMKGKHWKLTELTKRRISKSLMGNTYCKGRKSSMKGHTIEEVYGVEKAEKIRQKQSQKAKAGFKSGRINWNKGLTKETDERVKQYADKLLGRKRTAETIDKIRINRHKQILPVKDTKIELKIQNFLRELMIEYLPHKYMHIEHQYRCDIFIPDLNLVIEADGNYFHGNPEFFTKDRLNPRQLKQIELDKARTSELLQEGFKVLRLWENEINKMSIENFKERLR
jgi:very-short-patch-repair endonuclease